jgi:hypothetical protein
MTETAIVAQARYVRELQKSYYKGEKHLLWECKTQEKKLDEMIEELDRGQVSIMDMASEVTA